MWNGEETVKNLCDIQSELFFGHNNWLYEVYLNFATNSFAGCANRHDVQLCQKSKIMTAFEITVKENFGLLLYIRTMS